MQKARVAVVGAGLVLVVGIVVCWTRQLGSQGTVTWGGPTFCASERDYFMASMGRLFEAWDSRRIGEGKPGGGAGYLVIDVENRLVWLEPPAGGSQCNYVQLPAALSWKLCYRWGDEVEELPALTCLRRFDEWPGALALVGRGLNRQFFTCILHGAYYGSLYVPKDAPDPNTASSPGVPEELASILVTDPQRLDQIIRNRPTFAKSENTMSSSGDDADPLTQHKIDWWKIQKPLYQALEREVINLGFEARRILVQPRSDYLAGLAGVSLRDRPAGRVSRLWSFLRHRRRVPSVLPALPDLFFMIDAEGDGRWHCRRVQRPKGSRARMGQVKIDFFIEQPGYESEIASLRPDPDLGTPKWGIDLDTGTRVELIGVCTNQGSIWWAPDGSVLDNWPGYFLGDAFEGIKYDLMSSSSARNVCRRGMSSDPYEGRDRIAVILRVPSSAGFGDSDGYAYNGPASVYYGNRSPLLDRSGLPHSPGQYIILEFNVPDRDSISHALGIRVGGPQTRPLALYDSRSRGSGGRHSSGAVGPMRPVPSLPMQAYGVNAVPLGSDGVPPLQWIQLKNISLGPGQQTDFEMILAEDAGGIASTSQVQVRP